MGRILVSASEPSGDRMAAQLVEVLTELGSFEFAGVAGPAMRASGVEALVPMEDLAVMGVVEILSRLGEVRRAKTAMRKAIASGDYDLFVVVDGPAFHLPLARIAKDAGLPVIGYVCPQVWAWRPGRTVAIEQSLDLLLCLFAFEPDLFEALDARWVGHPVVDRLEARTSEPDELLFGLVPGSRSQEIDRLLEPFLATADVVRSRRPGARFLLPAALELPALPPHIEVVEQISDLSACRAVLTKSGTVTLELAVLGIPQVVAHRVHPLTYAIGRRLVTGVDHIALPNILARRPVVPELVQAFTPEVLADELLALPESQPVVLDAIGAPGATRRAADAIMEVTS